MKHTSAILALAIVLLADIAKRGCGLAASELLPAATRGAPPTAAADNEAASNEGEPAGPGESSSGNGAGV